MAQHDYVIDNQSAPSFRSDLNNALAAVVSQNSGATAPTVTFANMLWYDTANNQLKKRNEADSGWITLGTVDETLGTFTVSGSPAIASQAEAEAGIDNTKMMTPLRVEQHLQANNLMRVTGATLSGTSTSFTGIPSWVKRVTIFLTTASTSGTSNKLLQLGSGSIQTTGYVSSCMNARNAGTGAGSVSTTGFTIDNDSIASYVYDGVIKLHNPTGNVWFIDGILGDTTGIRCAISTGRVSLSGALDRFSITTLGGTDTYDSGSFDIVYE